ncbi:hypothetical protein [Jatrophihabitans lederbergiae]|uniref:Blue (type 1) copper domain-containing protein n=1 Tax=Jatrophihabitans lederbergiae TaxID=3075547 RepID=A0ABU2JHQ5_9ACTN|nr:hypothetical protein [Jatrophihabitans sp. DSM 44399]MDT0264511.1 hypothetical protein [Jatrophihabitans sp. DSM 44399]
MVRRLRVSLVGVPLMAIALAGCASMTGSGHSGMMGGGSRYHSAALTCSAPTSLPGRTVRVELGDMGMTQMMGGTAPMGAQMRLQATPATEPAGPISLVVSNVGWRTHELVIFPLTAGAVAGQRVAGPGGKVSETGSMGEASSSCGSGAGNGLVSGTVGWVTVTLAAGRYELVCNLPNHYADGMHQELTIS